MAQIPEKVQVTFNADQIRLISEYKGVFGLTKAEIVRSIVTNWLYEHYEKKK